MTDRDPVDRAAVLADPQQQVGRRVRDPDGSRARRDPARLASGPDHHLQPVVPPVDDPDAVRRRRERARLVPGERNREDRRDTADREQAGDRDGDAAAAELAGRRGRPLSPWGIERRVLLEDPALELLQLRSRFDAELVDEPSSRRPVGLERLGLPPAAVERGQPQSLEPLSQRVLARQ